MGFVAMIGLIFGPLVSLLFAAWFYVRWQNEEDEKLAQKIEKFASAPRLLLRVYAWWCSAC